jgi:hypothetical protein
MNGKAVETQFLQRKIEEYKNILEKLKVLIFSLLLCQSNIQFSFVH